MDTCNATIEVGGETVGCQLGAGGHRSHGGSTDHTSFYVEWEDHAPSATPHRDPEPPAPRCGEQAWQPHDTPHRPPNPPSPVCRLAPGHEGPHEGRTTHQGTYRWHSEEPTHPCIGGCGRQTNGYFTNGSRGAGWYCGWCHAIPA